MNRPTRLTRLLKRGVRAGFARRHGIQLLVIAGFCSLMAAAAGAAQTNVAASDSVATQGIAADLKRLTLDVSGARSIRRLKLAIPLGVMYLENGHLIPATSVGGGIAEFIFVGHGTLEHTPVDSIERAQLDFFSGAETLDAEFSAAAFVIPNNDSATALMKLPTAATDAAALETATKTWERWKNGTERRLLGIDGTLYADASGDPFQRAYFAVFARDETLGDFVYSFDPTTSEQLTIAQFVPLDATEKEKRKLRKLLDRQQRQGRFIGVTVDDLGEWDIWVQSSDRKNGSPMRGTVPFESTHYELDVTIGPGEQLTGKATVSFRAASSVAPAPTFRLSPSLIVQSVTLPSGEPLTYLRDLGNVIVILTRPPANGELSTVVINYSGKFLMRAASKTMVPIDSTAWHPRIGERDYATYDVTYRWRGRADLIAGGEKGEAPRAAEGRAERFRVETPTFGTTFALGSFEMSTVEAGHIRISVAFDSDAYELPKQTRDDVIDALRDSIIFFEAQFGALPFHKLNVVNVPRSFCQSLPGIVTLSTDMLGDYASATSTLSRAEDPRTIVAHEVAHFWWGHQITSLTYRDQWIEEALANYGAALFAREKLSWEGRLRIGPTTGWQVHLSEQLDDGRMIESVGPLVLGSRLDSSRASAYHGIVYMKGELVLEMIARQFGRDAFHRMLTAIARKRSFVATADLIEIFSTASSTDLSSFAQQFIYGTGIPTISYSYAFAPAGPNKWVVKGEARRITRAETRFKVTRLPNGTLDVITEWLPSADPALEAVVVPFKLGVSGEGMPQKLSREERKEIEKSGHRTVFGRLFLKGESTPFELTVENEPKMMWLDRDDEVFARFLSEDRSRKWVQLHLAEAFLAAGDTRKAEAALHAAIAAEDAVDSPLDIDTWLVSRREILKTENQFLDAAAHLLLAELSLRRGDVAAMRSEVERARKSLSLGKRGWLDDQIVVLEARAELLSGEAGRAFNRLKKFVLKRKRVEHGQAYALLAIAARQTGHQAEYEKAVERARRRGIDVTLLK